MTKLSVIMPAKNAERTLLAAARSTLRAMPDDAELLIADDASTDGTSRVAERLRAADRRVRLFTNETSVGAARARQDLLELADSDVIAAMDADDICLPFRFARLTSQMRGVEVLFRPIVRFSEGLRVHVPRPAGLPAAVMGLALLVCNPLPQSTMIGRRDALLEVGGYRDVAVAEDYDLWMRLVARGARVRMGGLPSVLYRVHGGQLTASRDYEQRVRCDADLRQSYGALAAAVGVDHLQGEGGQSRAEHRARLQAALLTADAPRFLVRALEQDWALPFDEAS